MEIRGKVIDNNTSKPIESATVEIFDEETSQKIILKTNKKGDFYESVSNSKSFLIYVQKEGYHRRVNRIAKNQWSVYVSFRLFKLLS